MNAILQLKDKKYETVIRKLVESSAKTDIKHPRAQQTAKDLAEEHGISNVLRSKEEDNAAWGKLVDLEVGFVLLVNSYVNNKTVNNVGGNIAKEYYNISIKEAGVLKDLQKKLEPKSVEQFQSFLNDGIKQNKKFERFSPPNDPSLANLAEKANALRIDDSTELGKPENTAQLTRLSLYAPIIYCDDSGSMRHENRYENQIELVTRIARGANKIGRVPVVGVELRFINNSFASKVSAVDIQKKMRGVPANGQTNIGTNLRTKILERFVYMLINQPVTANKDCPFKRPLLVCIITDGKPEPETSNTLRDEIVECKRQLKKKGYDPTAVMFCISQIGTSTKAAQFMDGLRNEMKIEDVIYCTVGKLDTKFKELKNNERALESWLVHLLAKPIMERHPE